MARDDEYSFSSNRPNQAKPSFRYEAENYLNIRSKKPKPWWLIAGIIFLIVIPFSILFTTDDIFDIGGMCFISSLIGIGFLILLVDLCLMLPLQVGLSHVALSILIRS